MKKIFISACLLGMFAPSTHAYNHRIPVNGKVVCQLIDLEKNIQESIIRYCEKNFNIPIL